MNIETLKFDSADNACHSLRVIAEKVRTGEMMVRDPEVRGAGPLFDATVSLRIITPKKKRN